MRLAVGDVIQVCSNRVGAQVRRGRVVEVIQADGREVRVQWDDGHESLFMPSGGIVRVVPHQDAPRGAARSSG